MRRIAIVVTTLFLTLTTTVTTVHNPPQQKAQITTVKAVKHCRVTRITTHSKPTVHHRKKHRKPAVAPRYATFVVTAYTAYDSGMRGDAITSSGTVATPWKTVAASRQWPYGTLLRTPDGRLLTVEDRGGAIVGNKLDLYVGSSKRVAYQFGRKTLRLQIVRIGKGR